MPPFNGSGVFQRIFDWTDDAANSIPITASRMDGDSDGFATGLSTCITKDGQTTVTANLPMSNFKHTGVALGTSRTDYADVASSQDGTYLWGGTSGGTGNAQTISTTPVTAVYTAGQTYRFKIGNSNTGATTLSVNALATKAIQQNGGALVGGELTANSVAEVVYDGIQFQLISVSGNVTVSTGLFGNGTVSLPSIAFASDPDTGIYRIGANNIGIAANGAKVLDVAITGLSVQGTINATSTITTQGSVTVGNNATTQDVEINVGLGRSGNGNSFIDLIGDTTYTDYGIRLIRGSSGANTNSMLLHRGTGNLQISASDAGSISLDTNGNQRITISSAGAVQVLQTLGVTGAASAASITVTGAASAATVTGAQVATQANMETGTATNLIVSPGRQQNHPGHPKAWVRYDDGNGGGVVIKDSYNVSGVVRNSAGNCTVSFTTAFANTNYSAVPTASDVGSVGLMAFASTYNVGSCVIQTVDSTTGTPNHKSDNVNVVFYGDQ